MSRRHKAEKRQVLPDAKFHDKVVAKFINNVMEHGKKAVAEKIVYSAFDIMAQKWKETIKAKGPTAVGMFGSGQWTIWEGYAANKLLKAGFRSNNLDPNALRLLQNLT